MQNSFDGSFYDFQYFQKGKETGKSHYQNYRWQPQRSFREALALIDFLKLDKTSYVLDHGCAYGFLVRAFRELEILADGCDISDYALANAPDGCWNCSSPLSFDFFTSFGYTHIFSKDVFEHMTKDQLHNTLKNLTKLAPKLLCIVPLGDNGLYRIPEYHEDKSHIIIENELWWAENLTKQTGWKLINSVSHILGIKDNWQYIPNGNMCYYLERL